MNTAASDDQLIDIGAGGGRLSYRHGPSLPKPCVHPIVTPRGHTLTGFQMSDHVWHRGLWFTIKFINGENFWEEKAPFGVQTSVAPPVVRDRSPGGVRIEHVLAWSSPTGGVVLRERRTLDCSAHDGISIIDWTSTLSAMADLVFDRTHYTTWGGYGGLTFRAQRGMHQSSFLLPGGETKKDLVGDRHAWVVLQGRLDGGPDERASVGIVDHPSNPRAAVPWYGRTADDYTFINAAFLFHDPMAVRAGESLTFRYRIATRDGTWTSDAFASLAARFRDDAS